MPDPRPTPAQRRRDRLLHGALVAGLVLFKVALLAAFVVMAR